MESNDKHESMLKIRSLCKKVNVPVPGEVFEYFEQIEEHDIEEHDGVTIVCCPSFCCPHCGAELR